jgi:hypothetical protein
MANSVINARTDGLRETAGDAAVLDIQTGDTTALSINASQVVTASIKMVVASGLLEHSATVSTNYSISSGNNAISGGPITVASGVSVTVPSGSNWTVT